MLTLSAWSAVTPEKILPINTFAVVTVPDLNAARKLFNPDPLSLMWSDPSMAAFTGKIEKAFRENVMDRIREEASVDPAEIWNLAQRQVTIALTHQPDQSSPGVILLVDSGKKELNVPIDVWSISPQVALDPSINTDTADFSDDLLLLDPNCRKTGEIVTLNYTEVEAFNQPLASRVENVNPFNMIDFDGFIRLRPESDSWVRTVETTGGTIRRTGASNRTFTQRVVTSTTRDTHIRSRNVSFDAIALRPYARYYPFFDGTSGIDIIPKLLEIEMVNGIFEPNETVSVVDGSGKVTATLRLARPDHKRGSITNPSETVSYTHLTLPTKRIV